MVPEISLTPQLETRFLKRFGFLPKYLALKNYQKRKEKKFGIKCYLGEFN